MSIKKIAEMTGLSITTVSHAINGTRKVSAESKKKIDRAVAEINYRPSLAAQMMKTQKSRIIALFVPDTEPNNSTNCFYFDVMNGARMYLEKNGYSLLVSTYPEDDDSYDLSNNVVLQHRWIDGVLLVPPRNKNNSVRKLQELGLPIVLIDRGVEDCTLPTVYSNNTEITKECVKLMAASGKKRIAYLGGNNEISSVRDRLEGYYAALQELWLPVDDNLVCSVPRYTVEAGEKATLEFLDRGIDAIFVANSILTLGSVKALNKRGISIPDQVSIIGFDASGWTEVTTPRLTTVVQKAYEMGEVASGVLLDILNGKMPEQQNFILPARISIQDSN